MEAASAPCAGYACSRRRCRIPPAPLGRRRFVPGTPQFADINVSVAIGGASDTQAHLDTWIDDLETGSATAKDGDIELLNAQLSTTEVTIDLTQVMPVAFPGFPTSSNQRTLTARLGRFELH